LRTKGDTGAAQKELNDISALREFRARLAQAKYLTLQGVEALKQQKLDDALSFFQKAVEQSPQISDRLLLSRNYLGAQRGNRTRSWRFSKSSGAESPTMRRRRRAWIAVLAPGRHVRGLEEFQQAVMSDPDLAEAHYNLGLALAQSGRLDESARQLNEAISLEPKYVDARVQLGLVLNQQNDFTGAANVFRELIRRDPNFAEAHNNLGLVMLQTGDLSGAEKEFSAAVNLKANYAEAHYNLALALHQEGKEQQSQAEFEKAFAIAPELRNAPRP